MVEAVQLLQCVFACLFLKKMLQPVGVALEAASSKEMAAPWRWQQSGSSALPRCHGMGEQSQDCQSCSELRLGGVLEKKTPGRGFAGLMAAVPLLPPVTEGAEKCAE